VKKFISIVLTACMLIGMLTVVPVFATEYTDYYFVYSVENEQAKVVGFTGNFVGGDVIIPSSVARFPVTALGNYLFNYRGDVTSVVIPEGVTVIPTGCFSGCSSLTSVTIPSTVTEINDSVFKNTALEHVYYNGTEAQWSSIFIDSWYNNDLYYATIHYTGSSDSEAEEGVERIEGNLKYIISNGEATVTGLIDDVRYELMSITIPSYLGGVPVVAIGESAFSSTNVTEVFIPEGVTTLGTSAFEYCGYLESITIPEGVTTIPDWCFYNCYELSNIELPQTLEVIGYYAFQSSGLTSITLPENVTTIGNSAFNGCYLMRGDVVIPYGVTKISDIVTACLF